MIKDKFFPLRLRRTKKEPITLLGQSKLFLLTISPLLILLSVLFFSLIGFATESSQTTPSEPPSEFSQPIAFSHKTHIEKGALTCEFCHIYARRSINSGAPVMAGCYGCHRVIAGSDEDPEKAIINQNAIKKLMEYQAKGESIAWKKIHDLPDFVHFSHKRHVQVGFDCTECHGEINQHDLLSTDTMIADLSMGWCMQCHREGRPAVDGQIAGPVRETRGGTIVKEASANQPEEILLGSKDCFTCHK